MDTHISAFHDYLLNQKSNSANTIESYMRDVSFFLDYLSKQGIVPLLVTDETMRDYVDYLKGLNRSITTISRNIASVRCFYKFLIFIGETNVNPAKSIKLEKAEKKLMKNITLNI